MKRLLSFFIVISGLALTAVDAEAAQRMGGGRNLGMQRSAPAPQKAAPAAQPAQQQPAHAAPATPAAQPSGLQKWLGPLAGLALGAGLAALFLNNGMAGLLSGLLVLGLVVAVVAFAARALLRGRVVQQPLRYAGVPGVVPATAALPGGAGAHSVAAVTGRWPADFDAADFTRHARLNFVKLQQAHDSGDVSILSDFLTPELQREVEADMRAAGAAPRKTEVVTLEAEVLELVEEAGSYVVSVRFSGLIREGDAQPEPFAETWHLVKPVAGRGGWLVAGIQQAQAS